MAHPSYSADEIVKRGKELYEREVRPKVEADNKGKVLVIDIETGAYEIDDDHLTAVDRALSKRADAPLFSMRIGYPALYRIGTRNSVSTR